jgi:hypothetical protein
MTFRPGEILDSMWAIIDAANRDPEALVASLQPMNRGSLIRFIWSYDNAMADLSPRMGAHLGLVSEDGLDDLDNWIVSQGRAYFEAVKLDPTQIPADWSERPPTERRSFYSSALRLFREKFGGVPPYQWS